MIYRCDENPDLMQIFECSIGTCEGVRYFGIANILASRHKSQIADLARVIIWQRFSSRNAGRRRAFFVQPVLCDRDKHLRITLTTQISMLRDSGFR